jgi:hypothetical protein
MEMIYTLTMLFWPVTLPAYYLLLGLQAFFTLRPLPDQRPITLASFTLQCLMPLLAVPIFWFCYYVWHPHPDPAEWAGSDQNGTIAFSISLGIACALFISTTILSVRRKQLT